MQALVNTISGEDFGNAGSVYLKENKWRSQRGLGEDGRYIELSEKLHDAIKQNKMGRRICRPTTDAIAATVCNIKITRLERLTTAMSLIKSDDIA